MFGHDLRDAWSAVEEVSGWRRTLMGMWFIWHTLEVGVLCVVILGPVIFGVGVLGWLLYTIVRHGLAG